VSEAAIRLMESRDIPAILQIQANSPEAAQWRESAYEKIGLAGENCWTAERHGILVGFLVARSVAGEMEILNLAVARNARRKGFAGALLQEAFRWGKENDVDRVFLEVRASNSAAREFYEARGFVRSGIRPNYYRDPVEDALVFARKLGQ
jgi:[ribosomal protein S18]-alanine N-acetyltransferase